MPIETDRQFEHRTKSDKMKVFTFHPMLRDRERINFLKFYDFPILCRKWREPILLLDPGQYWLTLLTRLCFTTSAKSQKKFLGPPLDQILDPLVVFSPKNPTPYFLSTPILFYLNNFIIFRCNFQKFWRQQQPITKL